jgi:hypothetical protein
MNGQLHAFAALPLEKRPGTHDCNQEGLVSLFLMVEEEHKDLIEK